MFNKGNITHTYWLFFFNKTCTGVVFLTTENRSPAEAPGFLSSMTLQ